MWRRNLTVKILLAVGITVAAVIAIYTYFVIRVQSAWWHERTHAQNAIARRIGLQVGQQPLHVLEVGLPGGHHGGLQRQFPTRRT